MPNNSDAANSSRGTAERLTVAPQFQTRTHADPPATTMRLQPVLAFDPARLKNKKKNKKKNAAQPATSAPVETRVTLASRLLRKGLITVTATVVSIGLFFAYYKIEPRLQPRPAAQVTAAIHSEPASRVVALDPTIPETEQHNPAAAEQEAVPASVVESSDVEASPFIDIEKRSFTFIQEPRLGASADYQLSTAAANRGASSQVGRLGFRPVPDDRSRFISASGDLEWQGGWELHNPAANVRRGDTYLRYLNSNFKRNIGDSLTAQRGGGARLTSGLSGSTSEKIPVIVHGK